MKESTLDAKIISEIRKRGGWAKKIHGNEYQQGLPDIIGCYKGHFIAFEDKAADGEITKLQAHELSQIKKAGGIAEEVRSLVKVRAILDSIDDWH